jgi:hypothetical protein
MRRMILVATLAAFGGFCLANASAFASLRHNVWRTAGETFQFGYVVGYLDAVRLAQRKDFRVNVPTGNDKDFARWVREVNAFYGNPANESRSVPDAMYEVGSAIRTQMLKEWGLKRQGRPVPSPSGLP